jgi:hypothetical protein
MIWRPQIGKIGCNRGAILHPFAPTNDAFDHPEWSLICAARANGVALISASPHSKQRGPLVTAS